MPPQDRADAVLRNWTSTQRPTAAAIAASLGLASRNVVLGLLRRARLAGDRRAALLDEAERTRRCSVILPPQGRPDREAA